MQSRVSSHPIEQSMCIPQENRKTVSDTAHRNWAQGNGHGHPVHRNTWAANRASCCFWVISVWEPLLLSTDNSCGFIYCWDSGEQIVWLQGLWSQLSQRLTGRFKTGLHLCFLGSKNNLHLPLNSAHPGCEIQMHRIYSHSEWDTPFKVKCTPGHALKTHSSSDCRIKDSSCAIPILTHHHWLLSYFPKCPIYDTSIYFHRTFNYCIKSPTFIQKQSYLFYEEH